MKKLSLDLNAEVERLRRVNARLMTAVRRGREDYAELLEVSHASIDYLRREVAALEAEEDGGAPLSYYFTMPA